MRGKMPLWVQHIMDIGYMSGLRISDILKIKLSDCKEGVLNGKQQKTGKKFRYEITGDLETVLNNAKAMPRPVLSQYLFPNTDGSQMSTRQFDSKFWYLKKKHGFQDMNFHFHDLRSKSATDEPETAQKRLGHASIIMTEGYIKNRKTDTIKPLKNIRHLNEK